MMFDLGIENGTLIRGSGRLGAHVYIRRGRIAAFSADRLAARSRIDASGTYVMPGMIDTHVHLMDPGDTSREDFPRGTAAAAKSGVTTIVEHTHHKPVRTVDDLIEKRRYLRDRSRVDFGLAAHAWPDHLDHIEPLWKRGASFFKVFTCTTHGVPGFDSGTLRRLLQRTAACGAICLIHCEDESITRDCEAALRSTGRNDGGVVPEWRHPDAELVALRVVAELADRTQARVVAAHLSSPLAVRALEPFGQGIIGESCPQYFALLRDDILVNGALRKFTPPARARSSEDLEAMWAELARGSIHHISSDHAPSTLDQKHSGSIWDVHFGLPGLDTTMAILLEAAASGRITYERLVEIYSEAPARAYGLAPKKGSLEVGSDADLVLVDPTVDWTISSDEIQSRAGWSPFEGRRIRGRPVATFLRGTQIAGDGMFIEPGFGRFVPGAGSTK